MTPAQLAALSDVGGFESSLFAVVAELQSVILAVRQEQIYFIKRSNPIPRQRIDEEQGSVTNSTFEKVRSCAKEYVLTRPEYSSAVSRHYRALKAFNQILARYDYIFMGKRDSSLLPQQLEIREKAILVFKTIQLGEYLYE